jgi:hypothetical protein
VGSTVASSALGAVVSVDVSGTFTGSPGVLFSDASMSFGPPVGPASVSVSASTSPCPPPGGICGPQGTGRGEAYADLATGKLGALVSGSHSDNEIWAFNAHATLTDTLVFHLPPGTPSMQLTISMTVDADLPAQNINGRVGGGALLGFGQDASFLYFQGAAGSQPTHYSQVLPVTTTVFDGLPIDITADLFASLLLIQTDHGAYTIDALHTAALSISVPAGVTYESTSGVFLTQVDEPSLVLLLSSSALGVFAAVRPATKRRRMRL